MMKHVRLEQEKDAKSAAGAEKKLLLCLRPQEARDVSLCTQQNIHVDCVHSLVEYQVLHPGQALKLRMTSLRGIVSIIVPRHSVKNWLHLP